MTERDYILEARTAVLNYINTHADHLDHMEEIEPAKLDEIRVRETRSVIGNWTILIETSFPSAFIYEIIFDKYMKRTLLKIYDMVEIVDVMKEELNVS